MASRKRDRTDTTDTYRPAPLVRTFSFADIADAVVRITSLCSASGPVASPSRSLTRMGRKSASDPSLAHVRLSRKEWRLLTVDLVLRPLITTLFARRL